MKKVHGQHLIFKVIAKDVRVVPFDGLPDGWLGLQFGHDALEDIIGKLGNERRALGRGDEPFEMIVLHDEPNEPMSLDLIHWLDDIGVQGLLLVVSTFVVVVNLVVNTLLNWLYRTGDGIVS